jgi:hypothetical protein
MRSTQRRRLLDQVERAMRGFLGELDHVCKAPACVRHFLVGEHFEARLFAEAAQRRLGIGGDAFQFGIEVDVELRRAAVRTRRGRRFVIAIERPREFSDVRAVTLLERVVLRHDGPN